MSKLIRRITLVRHKGDETEAVTVYREPHKRGETSMLTRPFERAARRIVKAHVIFGEDLLRRGERANRRRRDGWLLEAPLNVVEAGRKAYNEARKAVPFRILPKA